MAEQSIPDHDRAADAARRSGDPARIKGIYESYGRDLRAAFEERPDAIVQHGSARVAAWQGEHLPRLAPPGRTLDIGCGPHPEVSLRLARAGRRVVCMDISHNIVAVARDVAAREGARATDFVVGDAEALPFREGSFSLLVADDVIEHVPAPGAMVAECARVLTSDGVASISTPNRRAISVLVDRLTDLARGRWGPPERYYLVPSHLREYTRRELRRLFRGSFGAIRFATAGWDDPGSLQRLATAATARGPLRALSRHWIAILRGPGPANGP